MATMKEDKCSRCWHAWLWVLCGLSTATTVYFVYKETRLESRLELLERQFAAMAMPGDVLVDRLRREVSSRYQARSRVARDLPNDCSCPGQYSTRWVADSDSGAATYLPTSWVIDRTKTNCFNTRLLVVLSLTSIQQGPVRIHATAMIDGLWIDFVCF